MEEKMYWAARCKKCSGMVGYRDVRNAVDASGAQVAEKLPVGTVQRRCDHCGAIGVFDLRQLRPTAVKHLVPKVL
jgi:hypothetical protein